MSFFFRSKVTKPTKSKDTKSGSKKYYVVGQNDEGLGHTGEAGWDHGYGAGWGHAWGHPTEWGWGAEGEHGNNPIDLDAWIGKNGLGSHGWEGHGYAADPQQGLGTGMGGSIGNGIGGGLGAAFGHGFGHGFGGLSAEGTGYGGHGAIGGWNAVGDMGNLDQAIGAGDFAGFNYAQVGHNTGRVGHEFGHGIGYGTHHLKPGDERMKAEDADEGDEKEEAEKEDSEFYAATAKNEVNLGPKFDALNPNPKPSQDVASSNLPTPGRPGVAETAKASKDSKKGQEVNKEKESSGANKVDSKQTNTKEKQNSEANAVDSKQVETNKENEKAANFDSKPLIAKLQDEKQPTIEKTEGGQPSKGSLDETNVNSFKNAPEDSHTTDKTKDDLKDTKASADAAINKANKEVAAKIEEQKTEMDKTVFGLKKEKIKKGKGKSIQ